MATATATSRRAKPAPQVLVKRRELAEERVRIERKLTPHYDRIETIGTELKAIATKFGEFKEEFAELGSVTVAGALEAEFKGNVPQIQTEAWLALKELDRKRLIKSGVVKIEKQWGKASHGRVTVKVIAEKKA